MSSGFAGADFGFFEEIAGEPALETMTSEHPGAANLAAFETPATLKGAREVQSASLSGTALGRGHMLREVAVAVGRTYVLRSVNYRSSDVLVAFRVVRQDEDGSITLLWKLLRRFPTPDLKD